jgi:hypothetical protein
MDTGYYFVSSSGPGVYILVPGGIPSSFPTMGSNPIPGPYTRDVNDFYFGTSPTREDDADDSADPDGVPNLDPPAADGDSDDGAGILVIFAVTAPPPALFLTTVTSEVAGGAYWNFLIDLDQNGVWGPGEWVAADIPVVLAPGASSFLSSGWFAFGTHGGGFGRLRLPVWARNMVTDQSVSATVPDTPPPGWDGRGRGVARGFKRGEIEDYFIEWLPIGQMFPSDTNDLDDTDSAIDLQLKQLVAIKCPEGVKPGEVARCQISGPEPGNITVACIPKWKAAGAVAGTIRLTPGEVTSGSLEKGEWVILADMDSEVLSLNVKKAPEGSALLIYGEARDKKQRQGNQAVSVVGGALIPVQREN